MPTVVETEIDDMAGWLAFEAAMVGYDLVAADEIQIANINVQLAPAAPMFIDTPITDYSHYIWIRGTVYSDGRADDVSSLGNSLIDGGWGVGHTLHMKADNFRITDLEILNAGGTGAGCGVFVDDPGTGVIGYFHVARCIIHNTGTNTNNSNHGIQCTLGLAGSGRWRARIHNNIIYGMGGAGIKTTTTIQDPGTAAAATPEYGMIVNNTVCYCRKNGAAEGMIDTQFGAVVVKINIENNLAFNPAGSGVCYLYGTSNPFSGDRNISSDTTGSTGYQSATITDYFENAVDPASAGGQDFRLKTTAPKGIGEAHYYGDPMTMDIRRAGRTIEWDCGAYETAENIVDMDADYNYPPDYSIPNFVIRHMVRGWNEVRRALAALRNIIFAGQDNLEMGSTLFQPTWTAVTSNPTLTNGRLGGRWIAVGKRCIATYHLYLDGDEDLGVGAWRFTLPIAAQSGPPYIGSLVSTHPTESNAGLSMAIGQAYIAAGEQLVRLRSDSGEWSASVPAAWNGGDTLNFTIAYAID